MKKNIGIISVGSYLPDRVLTNQDLEKMVDTSDEWITTRTGIKERRLIEKGQSTSTLAINASKQALKRANLEAIDIDLIIAATITPDMQFPSVSCIVQRAIGAKNACCFDVSAACAGFIYAIVTARNFIAAGNAKRVLVIGAETLSTITDWQDRNTCVLFGDGAGACVMGESETGRILSTYLASDGNYGDLLFLPAGGSLNPATHETVDQRLHYIKMQGNELFKVAVKFMADAANIALGKAKLKCKDVDLIIPHQANIRILMAVAKKLGLSEEKVFLNIEKYGNMSSASSAVALCDAVTSGRIKNGDIVVLDAFGGGLVWGAIVIRW